MSDESILARVKVLMDQEHKLQQQGSEPGADHSKMRSIEQELDQCWDLLRQRRARREFDQNPDDAKTRDVSVVETYRTPDGAG